MLGCGCGRSSRGGHATDGQAVDMTAHTVAIVKATAETPARRRVVYNWFIRPAPAEPSPTRRNAIQTANVSTHAAPASVAEQRSARIPLARVATHPPTPQPHKRLTEASSRRGDCLCPCLGQGSGHGCRQPPAPPHRDGGHGHRTQHENDRLGGHKPATAHIPLLRCGARKRSKPRRGTGRAIGGAYAS